MAEIDDRLAVPLLEFGRQIGLSKNGVYTMARRGEIQTFRLGTKLFVPVRFRDQLLDSAGNDE